MPSLEPLTIHAGLAAHSMRACRASCCTPTTCVRPISIPAPRKPPRWRDCYRSLLGREEVRLVGCARASMEDYADWIGLGAMDKLKVVYNGLNFEQFPARFGP